MNTEQSAFTATPSVLNPAYKDRHIGVSCNFYINKMLCRSRGELLIGLTFPDQEKQTLRTKCKDHVLMNHTNDTCVNPSAHDDYLTADSLAQYLVELIESEIMEFNAPGNKNRAFTLEVAVDNDYCLSFLASAMSDAAQYRMFLQAATQITNVACMQVNELIDEHNGRHRLYERRLLIGKDARLISQCVKYLTPQGRKNRVHCVTDKSQDGTGGKITLTVRPFKC